MKTYYELLSLEQGAGAEDIKRAFRREIARYHPDKVQHLGPEFQVIAATRAAELTEAYRILMDPPAREAYDASLARGEAARPAAAGQPEAVPHGAPAYQDAPPRPSADRPVQHVSESMRQTQETLSGFVRKATIGRLREALDAVFGAAEPLTATGFDVAVLVKLKRGMFQKAEPPVQLLARIVARVDSTSVDEAWPLAVKAAKPAATVCLMLLGAGLAPARELATTIAEHRRRTRQGGPVVVPVDTRDWQALLPPDTPQGVRKLLERLKLGG